MRKEILGAQPEIDNMGVRLTRNVRLIIAVRGEEERDEEEFSHI
jgi:hypothetical protein